jgi:hypothetical protein
MGGPSFLRAFEIEIYQDTRKNALQAGTSLHSDPVEEPGGDSLAGTLWREKKSVSGFLS